MATATERLCGLLNGMENELPVPEAGDAGKVLMIGEDLKWKIAAIPSQLPAVTKADDEGKVLTVNSSGVWAAAALPD